MKTKFQSFLVRFKLDKHHRIERFGIFFFSLVFIMLCLVAVSFKAHMENSKLKLTEQAIYTTDAAWSLTGQNVSVVRAYRNESFTKAFILLEMDMSRMSLDAEDYQFFVTGASGYKLKNKDMTGSVYVFGNTGYIGLYFTDASGFEKMVYDIILRNTSIITADRVDKEEIEKYDDSSFKYHNQIKIFANLAGSDAIVAGFLEKDVPDDLEIYADVMASQDEEELRKSLNSTLFEMNNQMSLVNEYGEYLQRMKIYVPPRPTAIAGDWITDNPEDTKNNPTAFDESMLNVDDVKISSVYDNVLEAAVSDGSEGVNPYLEGEKLYLVTDFVFNGGFQYNYQDMKLSDFTLMQLMPGDKLYREWMADKKKEGDIKYGLDSELDNLFKKWYRFGTGPDGIVGTSDDTLEEYVYEAAYALAEDKSIEDAIKNYEGAVRKLYNLKKEYQTDLLKQLVVMEASAYSSANLFSIYSEKDALITY